MREYTLYSAEVNSFRQFVIFEPNYIFVFYKDLCDDKKIWLLDLPHRYKNFSDARKSWIYFVEQFKYTKQHSMNGISFRNFRSIAIATTNDTMFVTPSFFFEKTVRRESEFIKMLFEKS